MRLDALLRRDAPAALITRCDGQIRALDAEKRTAELTLSSETPVQRWGDTEILSHDETAIRLQRLREIGAIHLNHDTTQPVAAIREVKIKDRRLVAVVQFGRTALAEDAWKNVQDGVVRGVSVGYRIHKVQIDENARTITAIDWEPYEASLTTIPADPTVGVGRSADQESLWRSLTTNAGKPALETPVKYLRAILALINKHRHLESELMKRGEAVTTDEQLAELTRWADTQPPPQAGDEKERAEQLKAITAQRDIVRMAQGFALELSDDELNGIRSLADGQALLLRKVGEKNKKTPASDVQVIVTHDETDKRRDAAVDGLLVSTLGVRAVGDAKDLGLRRKSPCEILKALVPELRDADKDVIARFATGQMKGLNLRDANQSAANFTTVLGNYADKAVLVGYNTEARTHEQWTSERLVDDFKTVYGAAVQAGLLEEQVVKGAPGKEMNLTEKSYNATLGLFLRTIKFTYQDWRNDDLGLFAELLVLAGQIAANTEEWQVYKSVVEAIWTNYTTTSAAFWSDTNDRVKYQGFGNTQADLESRKVTVGSESVQINPVLGAVLVTPKRFAAARAVVGLGAVGNGPAAMPVDSGIKVIKTPWLSNSTLNGYNADDYFLVARNMQPVKVLRDRLFPRPRVMQIDAGATPDMHFLVMHAFRAKLAAQDGMQKGDWA